MKLLSILLLTLVTPVLAQDPTQVGPEIYKTILENENIRLFEVHFKPGDKIGVHSHPDHLAYVLSGGKLQLIYPDTSVAIDAAAGATFWIPAESHAAENIGDTDVRVLVLDLKLPKSDHPAAGVDSTLDPVKLAPENYSVLFENERVRLVKVHYEPGEKSPLHAHPANVVYALTGGAVRHFSKEGQSSDLQFSAGASVWREAETHASANPDTAAFTVLFAELKDRAPSPKN
jgi:quercetin dioxygenase-like cupin family protein